MTTMTSDINNNAISRSGRTLLISGCGACLGLCIAGYGLFTSEGTTSYKLPSQDIALVNRRPILWSDFVAQSENEYGVAFREISQTQRQKIFDDMMAEELYVQRGLELDLASSDPDVRTALVAGVQQQISADATAAMPEEAELRAWYTTHSDKYASEGTMRVRDLVLPADVDSSQDVARSIVQELRNFGNVDAFVAVNKLIEPRPVSGRSFDFAVQTRLGEALFRMAARLESGEVSDPLEANDGVHILVMVERQKSIPLPFEKARERAMGDYLADARERLLHAELTYLRSKADILVAPEFQK